MIVPFNPSADLILVPVRISGSIDTRVLKFVFDTGASRTIVTPDALDELGYNARDGEVITSISSVVGREFGYRIRVQCVEVFGGTVDDLPVFCHDIAGGDIDGLLGLDVMRHFDIEISVRKGTLTAIPAPSA